MAVAKDAVSTNNALSTSSFSWSHAGGTPKGVAVLVMHGSGPTAETITVTYGGVSVPIVSGYPFNTTGYAEGGATLVWHLFFLGSGIPTGTQSVVIGKSGAASTQAWCFTVTGAANTELVNNVHTIDSASTASPSMALGLLGRNSFVGMACVSGISAPSGMTPLTDWVQDNGTDYGSFCGASFSYNVIGSSDVTCGWTQALDDATATAFAISEADAGPASYTLDLEFGTFDYTGHAQNLIPPSTTYQLSAELGTYQVDGSTALRDLEVDQDAGSYALTGQTLTLVRGIRMTAAFTTYGLSGTNVVLIDPNGVPDSSGQRPSRTRGMNRFGRLWRR